jgi:hypothetical protein
MFWMIARLPPNQIWCSFLEVEENMNPGEFEEPRHRFMMITVVMIRQEDFP